MQFSVPGILVSSWVRRLRDVQRTLCQDGDVTAGRPQSDVGDSLQCNVSYESGERVNRGSRTSSAAMTSSLTRTVSAILWSTRAMLLTMVPDVKPGNNQVGSGEASVYPGKATVSGTSEAVRAKPNAPVARALSVLDRLLQTGDVGTDVHVVEPGHHGREQQQCTARGAEVSDGQRGGHPVLDTHHFSKLVPYWSAIRSASLPRSAEKRKSSRRSAAAMECSEGVSGGPKAGRRDWRGSVPPRAQKKPRAVPGHIPALQDI